jgi:tetratricopeptide (TPR) repeat protein
MVLNPVVMISLLLGLTVLALLAVNHVNRRELQQKLIANQAAAIRRRIAELEDLSAAAEPLLESTQIPRVISDEILHQLEALMQLEPDNHYLSTQINSARELSRDLSLEKRVCPLMRALSSDAQVARCKHQLEDIAKVVRRAQLAGRLDPLETDGFMRDLAWAQLMVQVITFVDQGHLCMRQHNPLKAYSYYKHAQQALIASHHPDERRHRLIREVSDLLTNKRRSLSLDLMPEAHNNPPDSLDLPGDAGEV